MAKNKEQEKTTIELEDEDMSFDDIEEEVEESKSPSDSLQKFMNEAIDKAKKQSIAYTDKRISQVNEKLAKHQELLESHTNAITTQAESIANLEKVVQGLATGNVKAVALGETAEPKKPANLLDATLGTVGGVAHGVVDTAAFLCESVIDLVTLGRARRPQN